MDIIIKGLLAAPFAMEDFDYVYFPYFEIYRHFSIGSKISQNDPECNMATVYRIQVGSHYASNCPLISLTQNSGIRTSDQFFTENEIIVQIIHLKIDNTQQEIICLLVFVSHVCLCMGFKYFECKRLSVNKCCSVSISKYVIDIAFVPKYVLGNSAGVCHSRKFCLFIRSFIFFILIFI